MRNENIKLKENNIPKKIDDVTKDIEVLRNRIDIKDRENNVLLEKLKRLIVLKIKKDEKIIGEC